MTFVAIGPLRVKYFVFCLQHFVDLAGSEKAAENTGNRFKEGCAINKSLFTLGNVIRKLSGDDK